MIVDVVIPARNEEASIGLVINQLDKSLFRHIIVCDNGSTDATALLAGQSGARVVTENKLGYGAACQKAIQYIRNLQHAPDIVLFLDGDFSDDPTEAQCILDPIIHNSMDLVIGSRVLGKPEKGSLMPAQKFGNWLSTLLIRRLYGVHFTDLGPFRAIRWQRLLDLQMEDLNFGWTVEMQVKAAKLKFNCCEVPVKYKKRIGISKVSGTVKGSIKAGLKILYTIFKLL